MKWRPLYVGFSHDSSNDDTDPPDETTKKCSDDDHDEVDCSESDSDSDDADDIELDSSNSSDKDTTKDVSIKDFDDLTILETHPLFYDRLIAFLAGILSLASVHLWLFTYQVLHKRDAFFWAARLYKMATPEFLEILNRENPSTQKDLDTLPMAVGQDELGCYLLLISGGQELEGNSNWAYGGTATGLIRWISHRIHEHLHYKHAEKSFPNQLLDQGVKRRIDSKLVAV
ncbi:hypothetical protein BC567DRAFT_260533 [Phyllosticta citribraziliensis]